MSPDPLQGRGDVTSEDFERQKQEISTELSRKLNTDMDQLQKASGPSTFLQASQSGSKRLRQGVGFGESPSSGFLETDDSSHGNSIQSNAGFSIGDGFHYGSESATVLQEANVDVSSPAASASQSDASATPAASADTSAPKDTSATKDTSSTASDTSLSNEKSPAVATSSVLESVSDTESAPSSESSETVSVDHAGDVDNVVEDETGEGDSGLVETSEDSDSTADADDSS